MDGLAAKDAMDTLGRYRPRLTRQQFKTLRGQILSGDIAGAMRGLKKIMEKKTKG